MSPRRQRRDRNTRTVARIPEKPLQERVLDAVTTTTERKKLTVGRMALAFPFAIGKLAKMMTTEDEDEALVLAGKLRHGTLQAASDTNPKRTRLAKDRRRKKLSRFKKTGS